MFIISDLSPDEKRLFNQHVDDAKAMIRTFSFPAGWSPDEKNSLAYEVLFRAAQTYDPNNAAKFSTYLYTLLRNEMYNLYKAQKRREDTFKSIETPIGDQGNLTLEDVLEDIHSLRLQDYDKYQDLQNYIKTNLDDRQLEIVRMLEQGYKYREIASEFDVSITRIAGIISDIRNKIIEYVKKNDS